MRPNTDSTGSERKGVAVKYSETPAMKIGTIIVTLKDLGVLRFFHLNQTTPTKTAASTSHSTKSNQFNRFSMFVGMSIKRASDERRKSAGRGAWVFLWTMANDKGSCLSLAIEKIPLALVKIPMLREPKQDRDTIRGMAIPKTGLKREANVKATASEARISSLVNTLKYARFIKM